MKLQTVLMLALLFVACPALAQTSSRDMKGGLERPQPSGPHEPATLTTPTQSGAVTNAAAPAAEKLDPAKEAAIRRLLDLTEESKMGERVAEYVMAQVREGMSNRLPADRLQKFMETFSQKFNQSASPSAITDAMVLIYAKYLSQDDVQALVKFDESPVGQRVVKAMPEISKESRAEGLEMDRKAMMAVLREMSDEYTELKPLFPPDSSKPTIAPAPGAAPAAAPAPGSAPAQKPAPAPPQQ
jgi:uncharacterized protein